MKFTTTYYLALMALFNSLAHAASIERIWLSHASEDPSSLVVNWETATPGNSVVEFGPDPSYGLRVARDESVTLHHVEIPLVHKDIVYHYRVRSGDDVSALATFKAYPTRELRVVIVGDWGYAKAEEGIPYFNTCLKGDGTPYKDPQSQFFASEDSYLLLTFKRGETTMAAQLKNLRGDVLDTRVIEKRRFSRSAN